MDFDKLAAEINANLQQPSYPGTTSILGRQSGMGGEELRRDDVLAALAEAQAEIARLRDQVGDWIVRADEANARADRMEKALRGDELMPQHVVRVTTALIDALHVLDTEAVQISDAINRSGGVDGVQVLEDAEKIIKAAAGLLISEMSGVQHCAALGQNQLEDKT